MSRVATKSVVLALDVAAALNVGVITALRADREWNIAAVAAPAAALADWAAASYVSAL